ncbi:MAG TPA: hypothetical protein VH677_02345 [Nitrososphaera sp.]|jgi:hypothetical protein
MYEEKDARETNVLSLRLPSERIEHLRKEASSRKVSLNVLANHILDAYFDFALPAKNVGFIYLPKKTVRAMVNALGDEEVSKLGRGTARADFVDLVYMLKGKLTLQSYLNTFLAWARDSNFSYRDDFDEGVRTITIHHDMGKKWSLLLKESLMLSLKDVVAKVAVDMRDDVLVLRVKEEG